MVADCCALDKTALREVYIVLIRSSIATCCVLIEGSIFFFFSSRRRHTRYWRDWSSDVCSSDLETTPPPFPTTSATPPEFTLAHWLVNGADGGRLFVRCFGGDAAVRENAAGDVLASLTTILWNAPSESWTGDATMADASLNRRVTVRLGDAVAFAQIGVVDMDGQIELEALRLFGLPEVAPALLCGTPTLPVGQREFAVEPTRTQTGKPLRT